MDKVKKNFGFGCMRLPMIGEEIDKEQFKTMIDEFMDADFNYFDTAHGYINEKSEPAIRECLAARYPRESYILTDKLSGNYFEKEEDIRPLFDAQLKACGVEYFDFYLMHAQNAQWFEKFKKCRAYETAFALKEEEKSVMWVFPFTTRRRCWSRFLPNILRLRLCRFSLITQTMNLLLWRAESAMRSAEEWESLLLSWSL